MAAIRGRSSPLGTALTGHYLVARRLDAHMWSMVSYPPANTGAENETSTTAAAAESCNEPTPRIS